MKAKDLLKAHEHVAKVMATVNECGGDFQKAAKKLGPTLLFGEQTVKDEIAGLRSNLRELTRRLKHAERLREDVAELFNDPFEPANFPDDKIKFAKSGLGEVGILVLSDWHYGEVVDGNQLYGLNHYSPKIAETRVRRLFDNAIDLLTTYQKQPIEKLYVIVLGDMISGDIHQELAETNALKGIPSVRNVVNMIIGGIQKLDIALPPSVEIEVVVLPGNHDRLTHKWMSKDYATNSYSTLIGWGLDLYYQSNKNSRIKIACPESGDAIIKIYGWTFAFTHGDRTGGKGGHGGAGVAAPAARGEKRVREYFTSMGLSVDYVVVGHWHVGLELEAGWVNSSLIGPNQYGQSGRLRPAPASQSLLTVHPERGWAQRWRISVGHPDEGSIYKPRMKFGKSKDKIAEIIEG